MNIFTFNTSKSIISQPGGIAHIGEICQELNLDNPLVVTDQGIADIGLLARLEQILHRSGLNFSCYDRVVADPPESVVLDCLNLARDNRIDGVIGFGGGSSLDTAKLVALMLGSGESLSQIYGIGKARGPRLPLILIPTTAGTGSEVTPIAIVTTGETTKTGVVSPHLLPDVALLDAELTLGLPPRITAATGIDAMVHGIESYTSAIRKNPYSDMFAREALRLLAAHIRTATHDGSGLEARQAMLLGACLAGQAFANAPVAAVHALAYPLGGHYHIPHGLSNSLILPHVLRHNAPHGEKLYSELADIIFPGKAHGTDSSKTEYLISGLEDLIADLGLPARLGMMDIDEADLPMLAADAMKQQRLLVNNPCAVTEQGALGIYQAAY